MCVVTTESGGCTMCSPGLGARLLRAENQRSTRHLAESAGPQRRGAAVQRTAAALSESRGERAQPGFATRYYWNSPDVIFININK